MSGSKDVIGRRTGVLSKSFPGTDLKTVRDCMHNMDEQTFRKYVAAHDIWSPSLTIADSLVVPAGFLVSEKVSSSAHLQVRFGSGSTGLQVVSVLEAGGRCLPASPRRPLEPLLRVSVFGRLVCELALRVCDSCMVLCYGLVVSASCPCLLV